MLDPFLSTAFSTVIRSSKRKMDLNRKQNIIENISNRNFGIISIQISIRRCSQKSFTSSKHPCHCSFYFAHTVVTSSILALEVGNGYLSNIYHLALEEALQVSW